MDKKFRPIHAGFGFIFGTLLTTSTAFASVMELASPDINTNNTQISNGINKQFGHYNPEHIDTNPAIFSYSQGNADLGDEPTSVPAPAAAWLFGSGLIGLLGLGRKRKKPR